MISQLNSNIDQSVDTYLVNVMGICIDFLSIDPGNGFFYANQNVWWPIITFLLETSGDSSVCVYVCDLNLVTFLINVEMNEIPMILNRCFSCDSFH